MMLLVSAVAFVVCVAGTGHVKAQGDVTTVVVSDGNIYDYQLRVTHDATVFETSKHRETYGTSFTVIPTTLTTTITSTVYQ